MKRSRRSRPKTF